MYVHGGNNKCNLLWTIIPKFWTNVSLINACWFCWWQVSHMCWFYSYSLCFYFWMRLAVQNEVSCFDVVGKRLLLDLVASILLQYVCKEFFSDNFTWNIWDILLPPYIYIKHQHNCLALEDCVVWFSVSCRNTAFLWYNTFLFVEILNILEIFLKVLVEHFKSACNILKFVRSVWQMFKTLKYIYLQRCPKTAQFLSAFLIR